MLAILRRLFCRHQYRFLRVLHGDEIGVAGYERKVWKCDKCGRYFLGERDE